MAPNANEPPLWEQLGDRIRFEDNGYAEEWKRYPGEKYGIDDRRHWERTEIWDPDVKKRKKLNSFISESVNHRSGAFMQNILSPMRAVSFIDTRIKKSCKCRLYTIVGIVNICRDFSSL